MQVLTTKQDHHDTWTLEGRHAEVENETYKSQKGNKLSPNTGQSLPVLCLNSLRKSCSRVVAEGQMACVRPISDSSTANSAPLAPGL